MDNKAMSSNPEYEAEIIKGLADNLMNEYGPERIFTLGQKLIEMAWGDYNNAMKEVGKRDKHSVELVITVDGEDFDAEWKVGNEIDGSIIIPINTKREGHFFYNWYKSMWGDNGQSIPKKDYIKNVKYRTIRETGTLHAASVSLERGETEAILYYDYKEPIIK